MRPIEFRAKFKGDFVRAKKGDWFYFDCWPDWWKEYYHENNLLDHETLGQFTGLFDKNGKKIFEGDILRTPDDEIGKVIFTQGSFCMEFLPPHNWDPMVPAILLDNKNFEIIGNFYENPELIK